MIPIDASVLALYQERRGFGVRYLAWIVARNRSTDADEGLGLQTGWDSESITVTDQFTGSGVTRTFHGAGEMLGINNLVHETGLNVRPLRVSLSAISPAVENAVRLYDAKGAPFQVWRRVLHPDTGLQVGQPVPVFKGYVDSAPIPRPVVGGEAVIEMEVVSTARDLTLTYGQKKSQAALQRRDAGDKLRQYKASAATIQVTWGDKEVFF